MTPERIQATREGGTARTMRALLSAAVLAAIPAGQRVEEANIPPPITTTLPLRPSSEHMTSAEAADRNEFVAIVLRTIAEKRKEYGLFPDFDDRAKGILGDYAPFIDELAKKYHELPPDDTERARIETLVGEISDKILDDIDALARELGGNISDDTATDADKAQSGIPIIGQKKI